MGLVDSGLIPIQFRRGDTPYKSTSHELKHQKGCLCFTVLPRAIGSKGVPSIRCKFYIQLASEGGSIEIHSQLYVRQQKVDDQRTNDVCEAGQ